MVGKISHFLMFMPYIWGKCKMFSLILIQKYWIFVSVFVVKTKSCLENQEKFTSKVKISVTTKNLQVNQQKLTIISKIDENSWHDD